MGEPSRQKSGLRQAQPERAWVSNSETLYDPSAGEPCPKVHATLDDEELAVESGLQKPEEEKVKDLDVLDGETRRHVRYLLLFRLKSAGG